MLGRRGGGVGGVSFPQQRQVNVGRWLSWRLEQETEFVFLLLTARVLREAGLKEDHEEEREDQGRLLHAEKCV